ncbi:NlpC/P60 family protein [Streptomyces sp. NPDC046805]|uniref:C40 family peptidase n=1 Tax=Streptomyces sp. NPDC046805 TaxID=3155134 RepID=UPI0033D980D2
MAPESRDEVRQRVNALYEEAELATGNYNATRAMNARTRTRGVPLGSGPGGGTDPALEDITRQWFDAARSRLGPTVPAVLPADRVPQRRPVASRPALPAGDGLARSERELTGRPVVPALPAGTSSGPVAELTSRPAAELEARPLLELTSPPVIALPAVASEPPRPTPTTSKDQNRRKLTAARELLVAYAARQSTTIPAAEPRPAPEPTYLEQIPEPTYLEQIPEPTYQEQVPEPTYQEQVTKAMKAVAFARAQVGRPCVWGATGPDSYDHTSLTRAAWKAAGVALPRSTREQATAGTPVPLDAIQGGDLVFFFDNDSHVGVYVGDGMMVHAPGPGARIREESIFGAGKSAIHRVIRPA